MDAAGQEKRSSLTYLAVGTTAVLSLGQKAESRLELISSDQLELATQPSGGFSMALRIQYCTK